MPRQWGAKTARRDARRFAQLERKRPPDPPSRRRPRVLRAMTAADWMAVDTPSAAAHREEQP